MSEYSNWTRRPWARRRFLAGAGALGAAFVAACGGGSDKKETSNATTAAGGGSPAAGAATTAAGTQAAAKNLPAIKLGGMIDRTGAVANVGKPLGDGSLDFAAYANGSNLFGRKMEWVEFDNGY